MIMSYYIEGANCFDAGVPVDDNPYPANSEAHRSWESGWDSAWFDSHQPGAFK